MRTSIRPEHNIISIGIIPTFKEVKKEMIRVHVNIASIGAEMGNLVRYPSLVNTKGHALYTSITKLRFLDT